MRRARSAADLTSHLAKRKRGKVQVTEVATDDARPAAPSPAVEEASTEGADEQKLGGQPDAVEVACRASLSSPKDTAGADSLFARVLERQDELSELLKQLAATRSSEGAAGAPEGASEGRL